jgi:hypothetical protein
MLGLSLSACTIIKKEGFNIKEHVVMVDGDGELIDPRANVGEPESHRHLLFWPYSKLSPPSCKPEKPEDPTGNFCELFTSIQNTTPTRPGTDKRRILIFVHERMNMARRSIE